MNKLAGIVVVLVMGLVGLAGYFYMHPHHLPSFVSPTGPGGFQVTTPKSPMTNFRPPSF